MSVMLDSSVLRDYLLGASHAKALLANHPNAPICALTVQELLEAPEAEADLQGLRIFLHSFEALPITVPITEEAVWFRTRFRINVPCALIWATARQNKMQLLVSPNSFFRGIKDPSLRVA